MRNSLLALVLLAGPLLGTSYAQPSSQPTPPLRGHVDWQAHPAMHVPYELYGEGLAEETPKKKLSWRHTLRQTMYAPYLRQSGVRILVAAAMAAERAKNGPQARALILSQLAHVRLFVRQNSADFALATSPAQARRILTTTRKIVVLQAIEGARWVLNRQADADYWARQGVMMMTLVHLQDDEFGGAAINTGIMGPLLNMGGAWRRLRKRPRGLSDQGRRALRWLAQAGILVDLTHMSPECVRDALRATGQLGIPPLVTHGWARSIRADERSFSDEQIVEVYRQGGCFQLPLNGGALDPRRPSVKVPRGLRKGTLDSFGFQMKFMQGLLARNVSRVFPGKRCLSELSDAQRTRISVGWSSDWNGFTNHSKPTHRGRKAKRAQERGELLEVDTRGLAHPGLLPQYWQRLAEQGLDLDPLERQVEQLLRVWGRIRAWTPPRSLR
ncbi:MAG TPA: hypothetical protein DEA08_10675 [Planctomycetes bacterium]|nr:hypothetical protein [Planctomycetota bacterium]